MGKKKKGEKITISEQEVKKAFDPKTEADKLWKEAQEYNKKGGNRTGMSVFLSIIACLLIAVAIALIAFPLLGIGSMPKVSNKITLSIFAAAALCVFVAFHFAMMYRGCLARLVRRSEILSCTPLYIKMV